MRCANHTPLRASGRLAEGRSPAKYDGAAGNVARERSPADRKVRGNLTQICLPRHGLHLVSDHAVDEDEDDED
jgi:hypothetical protein